MSRNHFLLCVALAAATGLVGYGIGRVQQHWLTGHHYKVYEEETFAADFGKVHLRYVLDRVGLPFFDPGTHVVSFDDDWLGNVTLYRANRVFQESVPSVNSVSVSGNKIQWEDGKYRYTTRIEKAPEKKTDGPVPAGSDSSS